MGKCSFLRLVGRLALVYWLLRSYRTHTNTLYAIIEVNSNSLQVSFSCYCYGNRSETDFMTMLYTLGSLVTKCKSTTSQKTALLCIQLRTLRHHGRNNEYIHNRDDIWVAKLWNRKQSLKLWPASVVWHVAIRSARKG